eukprot:Nitzschia sp. Nitz4//NODE_474_length_16687_cov_99.124940//12648//14027//NITZ4_additional_000069-RA//1//CDS//3329531934//6756//frame0
MAIKDHIYQRKEHFREVAINWKKYESATAMCLDLTSEWTSVDAKLRAIQIALRRPEIDILDLNDSSYTEDKRVHSLLKDLLAEDRDWKVSYNVLDDFYDEKSFLKVMALFKKAQYLQLNKFDSERMIPLLRKFRKLQELDLSSTLLDSYNLDCLFQDEILSQKVSHITLAPETSASFRIPRPTTKVLRCFTFHLDAHSWPVFPEWISELYQCDNLRFLNVVICPSHIDYSESIHFLARYISDPCCRVSNLYIGCGDPSETLSVEDSMTLMEAIGLNKSIVDLCFRALNQDVDWSKDVYPQLYRSPVCYLAMKDNQPEEADELLEWLVRMRPTRLLTTDTSLSASVDYYCEDCYSEVIYVSQLHQRWKNWLSTYPQERPSRTKLLQQDCTSLTEIPPRFWARELECTMTHNEDLERLSLDASFYLLQNFLGSIEEMPSARDTKRSGGRQKMLLKKRKLGI